jgi:hypothetical protein
VCVERGVDEWEAVGKEEEEQLWEGEEDGEERELRIRAGGG